MKSIFVGQRYDRCSRRLEMKVPRIRVELMTRGFSVLAGRCRHGTPRSTEGFCLPPRSGVLFVTCRGVLCGCLQDSR